MINRKLSIVHRLSSLVKRKKKNKWLAKNDGRKAKGEKLRNWVRIAKKSGLSNSEIVKRLKKVGWEQKDIPQLPAPKIDFVFLFGILISITLFAVLYHGPAILGAFAGIGGSEWENTIEIAISSSKQYDTENIMFGDFKPANCAEGIYIKAYVNGTAIPVNFATKNESYENHLCTETDVEFENIGYLPDAMRLAPGAAEFSSQPIILITHIIYYGKILVETNTTPNETSSSPAPAFGLPEKNNGTEDESAVPQKQDEQISVPTQAPLAAVGAGFGIKTISSDSIATNWSMFRHDLNKSGFTNIAGPTTNNLIWNFTANNFIISSPAVVDGIAYFGSDDGQAYAVNASNGSVIWNYTIGASDVVRGGPAVSGIVAYFPTSGSANLLFALNKNNGTQIWNSSISGGSTGSPTVANNIIYIGASGNIFYALNASNGSQIWSFAIGSGGSISSPAIVDNRAYVGGQDNFIHALNASNGTELWNVTTGSPVSASPTVVNNRLYVGSISNVFYALNATNGTQLWNFTVSDDISDSAAVYGDVVYFGSLDNNTYALNATNGAQIWNFTANNNIDSSPAIGNNSILYIGGQDNQIYALNATNGSVVWNYTTRGIVRSSPALALLDSGNPILVIGSNENKTYAFRDASVADNTPPSVTSVAPVNITTFGMLDKVNISAIVTDAGTISAVLASITHPGGALQNITLVLSSSSNYNRTFANTTINGTYTARFIANDTAGNTNSSVTTSFIISGSTFVDVVGLNFTLEDNRSTDIVRVPQFGVKNVLVENGSFIIARLVTDFSINGTISLSGIAAAAATSSETKSVLYRSSYPNNITRRDLFIPSVNSNNAMFVCPVARSFAEVNDSCTGKYSAFAETSIFGSQEYSILRNISGTGAQAVLDWPMFKQNIAHTGFVNLSGPSSFSVLWNFTTNNTISYSSPAVSEGIVYFGSDDNQTYALNASNGTRIWNSTGDSMGSASPAVANGIVYIASDGSDTQLYALNASNGSAIWNMSVIDVFRSAPAVANGMVYVGTDNNVLYAVNASTGARIWNFTALNVIRSSPAVSNGMVYFGAHDFQMRAVNATNGSLIWNRSTLGAIISSPAVAGNIVYFGSADYNAYALNATNGSLIWNITLAGTIRSTPAIAFGRVYIGTNNDNATFALNASNGTQIWNFTVGNGNIDSSPIVSNNSIVYFGTDNGTLFALNATNGTHIWNYTTTSFIRSTPALARVGTQNVLFFGSGDNKTYAIVDNSLPGTPTLFNPGNDSLITNLTPVLNWTIPADADSDTLHFQLQIANDSAFTQLAVSADSATSATGFVPAPPLAQNSGNASFTVQSNMDFKQYFWRVRAYDGTGYGTYSSVFQFNVTTSVACDISLLNVSFGSSINPLTTTNMNSTANYAGFGNGTTFNITSTSNVAINITHRATNMSCLAGECAAPGLNERIDAENISWTSNTSIANGSNMLFANRIAMQGAFDNTNKVATNMQSTTTAWLRFWLAIRGDQGGGNYTGTYTARCVQA